MSKLKGYYVDALAFIGTGLVLAGFYYHWGMGGLLIAGGMLTVFLAWCLA